MEKWVIAAKRADFNQIGQQFHIDPVIARLIRNRDVIGEDKIREYLSGTVQELPSPWLMKDMEKAVDILEKKISQKAKVRIIGDYDIDGVTSTYILMKGLARIGADVDTYIPDRVADGYGIHAHLIERAETDRIDTIVTCDNGIAAAAEIQMAKDKGMTVIITDHHEVPYREEKGERQMVLPPADAILNPKQYDCPYPNKNLCGAVVAFKYIAALYERFGVPAEELEDYYELAAIATVGDVMDLQGENRILVKEGLCRLKNTKNQGLQELIRANSLEDAKITAYHIGFVLGPCINASGRLDTATRSLALLNAKTKEEAARLAGIHVGKTVIIAFVINGALCGLAGAMAAAYCGGANQDLGTTYFLPSVAAAFVGGTNAAGGKSSVVGVSIGALMMTLMSTFLNAAKLDVGVQRLIQGVFLVFLLVVAVSDASKKK